MNVFKSCGIMFDMSRDGVMKVDALKKYIKVVSQMGIDTIYLYLEDTYELKDYPMFGYMRGRYSHEEYRLSVSFLVLCGRLCGSYPLYLVER